MGRHKKWRAQAKKIRRKGRRQKAAKRRDYLVMLEQEKKAKSPRYQEWLKEQEELQIFEQAEETRLQLERHAKWEVDEELAQLLWRERQKRLVRAKEEQIRQELRIRVEWEEEQRKLHEEEKRNLKREEEKKQRQEELLRQIDKTIKKGEELPFYMVTSNETHPDKPPCPFFSKTGACRFGDWCSRNHVRPSVSKVLLLPNFYSHFGLDQALVEEYDTDVMLEYGDIETYQHFKDFFDDVLPEFERHGKVVQFKVCRNLESHLRGNVYVEYDKICSSVAAYKTFQGRWYGGRQLNVEFSCVLSWKSAICGLYFQQRCPKGHSCNFLHVFQNPARLFDSSRMHSRRILDRVRKSVSSRRRTTRSWSRSPSSSPSPSRTRKRAKTNWRWSVSPEPESVGNVSSRCAVIPHKRNKNSSSGHRHRSRDSGSNRIDVDLETNRAKTNWRWSESPEPKPIDNVKSRSPMKQLETNNKNSSSGHRHRSRDSGSNRIGVDLETNRAKTNWRWSESPEPKPIDNVKSRSPMKQLETDNKNSSSGHRHQLRDSGSHRKRHRRKSVAVH